MTHKKILVVGGTQMVGRDFVELLVSNPDNEYDIYLVNRGLTNSHQFANLRKIYLDRNNQNECKILNNQYFDVVVDFSCYTLNQFENINKNIQYKHYIFISTTATLDERLLTDTNHPMYLYAYNKKVIEEYIRQSVKNTTIVRPCIIYGSNDYTNRFYHKDNNFYRVSDNTLVVNDRYHVFVKNVSYYLSLLLGYKEIKYANIDGNGMLIQL